MKREENITDIASFLADYASLLAGCGATCIRIAKNTSRMAAAAGLKADISVMPDHVYVALTDNRGYDSGTVMRKNARCGISFSINARLSRLSWELADGKIGFREAEQLFESIKATHPAGRIESLLLTSLANASFCRLFGGDAMAMLIVFLSTLAGYRLRQIMLAERLDIRLAFLCASFFSATISAAGHVFGISATPETALGTSVLYLIPGVPYINSVSDLFYRHYLCAFSRLADAAVLTACLSAGLCAGMAILGLRWF